jgi:hypothetical protein
MRSVVLVVAALLGHTLAAGCGSSTGPKSAAGQKSSENVKKIAQALHRAGDEGGLAPAIYDKKGTALLSWRVALLPHLGEGELYKQFKLDEPWDSEHNQKLLDKIPEVYKSPIAGKAEKPSLTYYQVFVGPGAAFEPGKATSMPPYPPSGQHGTNPWPRNWNPMIEKDGLPVISDFADGVANTLLLAEAGTPVPWTKPADLSFEPGQRTPSIGGLFEGFVTVAWADGWVKQHKAPISEGELKKMITRKGGEALQSPDEIK